MLIRRLCVTIHSLFCFYVRIMAEINPFDLNSSIVPFVGRESELSRLHHALANPQAGEALVYVGRRHIGKTALLNQFDAIFDEMRIGIYLPLQSLADGLHAPLNDEASWLRTLHLALHDALTGRGFSPERMPRLPLELEAVGASAQAWRDWLAKTALPEMLHVIRAARQIVLLLDDAGYLARAIEAGRLPPDHAAFLHGLLSPQFRMVLTLSEENENKLELLKPLVNPAELVRIGSLSTEQVTKLLNKVGIEDAQGAAEVYRATGGLPELVRLAGYHLWQMREQTPLTPENVKRVLLNVYADGEAVFRQIWESLNRSERLVMTAAAGLLYIDPLRPISAEKIETWLVETDYPTDLTTVQSSIRALEYRQIVYPVTQDGATGIMITSGLMQKWLLENARVDTEVRRPSALEPTQQPRHQALWIAVAVGIALFVLLVIAFTSGGAQVTPGDTVPPTVTLSGE